MTKYAIYIRSATDATQAKEQLQACEEFVKDSGGEVFAVYKDETKSGVNRFRHFYQRMLEDAAQHKFDAIVAEDLSRLTRGMEDAAYLYKLCQIHRIQLLTLSEGEINEANIGLKAEKETVLIEAKNQTEWKKQG